MQITISDLAKRYCDSCVSHIFTMLSSFHHLGARLLFTYNLQCKMTTPQGEK